MFLLVVLLSPALYWLLTQLNQVPDPPEYSSRQKKFVLDTFATALLRIRDDKYSRRANTTNTNTSDKDSEDAERDMNAENDADPPPDEPDVLVNLYRELLYLMLEGSEQSDPQTPSAMQTPQWSAAIGRQRAGTVGGGSNSSSSKKKIRHARTLSRVFSRKQHPAASPDDSDAAGQRRRLHSQLSTFGRRRIPRTGSTSVAQPHLANNYALLMRDTSKRGAGPPDKAADDRREILKIVRTEGSKQALQVTDLQPTPQPHPMRCTIYYHTYIYYILYILSTVIYI